MDQDQDQFFDYNDFGGGDELAPTQGEFFFFFPAGKPWVADVYGFGF